MIKEFEKKDAQKLADMFNESNAGWPGRLTHGMEVTEVVLDWKKNIMRFQHWWFWITIK